MNHLIDTNIISELARPRPNAGVIAWADDVSEVAVSAITVDEIFYGLAWKPNARIEIWLSAFLKDYCHVLPVTDSVARLAGKLRGQQQANGIVRTQADMLIAATGAAHGLTVVTRNDRDFTGCGVPVLNPFRAP
jgi:toxin FitB